MITPQEQPQYQTWKFKYAITDEGQYWHWAEYFFRDEEGLLVASSPTYIEGASDFYCLLEDAPKVARMLEEGITWQQANKHFRESW